MPVEYVSSKYLLEETYRTASLYIHKLFLSIHIQAIKRIPHSYVM